MKSQERESAMLWKRVRTQFKEIKADISVEVVGKHSMSHLGKEAR